MKKNIRRILILPIIVCLILSSLSLYSCDSEPVTKWHYGEKAPEESLTANLGDYYFESYSCDVYTYTDDGWEFAFSMKGNDGKSGKNGKNGKTGKDGETWLSGEGKPSDRDGKNGDCYFNTKSHTVYEKKDGRWHYQIRISDKRVYDYATDEDGELKILCIGNSFTKDTTQFVPEIFHSLGIHSFELGHLYIANCSVKRHYANLIEDPTLTEQGVQTYEYRLNSGDKWVATQNHPIKDAILSEDWDFVVFQHVSAGELDYGNGDVEYYGKLTKEVRKYCPDSVFVWNMTWAYSQEYMDGRNDMNGMTQLEKYQSITANTQQYFSAGGEVSFANPIGTAIQNARSSYLGDTLNRDGSHLNYGVGCYTAGLTFVGSITGIDISEVQWRPTVDNNTSDPTTEEEQKIAIESAVNALENPYSITESKYK